MNDNSTQMLKHALKTTIDTEALEKELASGHTIAEFLKISKNTIASLYKKALHLFEIKHYDDAMHAFLLLSFLEPNNFDILLGLGMSLQMCKHYEAAISAYELGALEEPENPVSYFYLAKCLFAIHDHESAMTAIEMAIEYSQDDGRYRDILDQARTAKQSLLRRQ